MLRQPEITVKVWKAMRSGGDDANELDIRAALHDFDELWEELFPAEQARLVNLLVERVDLTDNKLKIKLRLAGLNGLLQDLRASPEKRDKAA